MPESGPVAAYLYVLSLDGPDRAWEYLRRNAGYSVDWRRHGHQDASRSGRAGGRAEPWGLRFPGGPRLRRADSGTRLAA